MNNSRKKRQKQRKTSVSRVANRVQPVLSSRENFLIDISHLKDSTRALGPETGEALEELESRRVRFLRCSGMHEEFITKIVREMCTGAFKSASIAYVAPALYEGIPEFLDRVTDGLGELAVYSSLYMGLVSVAGFTDYIPAATYPEPVQYFYNGVFGSMFMHTGVVAIAIYYRLAAMGQLRDSDKLLFLWRSRYVTLISCLLFTWGTFCAVLTLMYAVEDSVATGHACFPEKDPSVDYITWWSQWTGAIYSPVGQGIVHPKGEMVLNPWMRKAKDLNITARAELKGMPFSEVYSTPELKMYNEFMMDHFGFGQPCLPQAALGQNHGGFEGFSMSLSLRTFCKCLRIIMSGRHVLNSHGSLSCIVRCCDMCNCLHVNLLLHLTCSPHLQLLGCWPRL